LNLAADDLLTLRKDKIRVSNTKILFEFTAGCTFVRKDVTRELFLKLSVGIGIGVERAVFERLF
jgi:hypothetical protein